MTPTSRLYDALNDYLRQSEYQWRDVRHLKTLCWMVIGILESQSMVKGSMSSDPGHYGAR